MSSVAPRPGRSFSERTTAWPRLCQFGTGRASETTEAAELLKLVLYAGLSITEAGRVQGVTRAVAYRQWDDIRSWFAVHFRHASH